MQLMQITAEHLRNCPDVSQKDILPVYEMSFAFFHFMNICKSVGDEQLRRCCPRKHEAIPRAGLVERPGVLSETG